MPPPNQSLAMGYNLRRMVKPKRLAHGGPACPDCAGGKSCMAHGGEAESQLTRTTTEELGSDVQAARRSLELPSERPMPSQRSMTEGIDEMPEHPMSLKGAMDATKRKPRGYAEGGVVDDILSDRRVKRLPAEAEDHVEAPEEPLTSEPAFGVKEDYSDYHEVPDAEHDDPPAEVESLVGQILHDRRMRRRENR